MPPVKPLRPFALAQTPAQPESRRDLTRSTDLPDRLALAHMVRRLQSTAAHPDIVSGYQALVCSYDRLNRFGESLNAANAALSLPIPDHYRKIPFVKKHLKFIERIRKKYTAQQGGVTNKQSFLMSLRAWHSSEFQDF